LTIVQLKINEGEILNRKKRTYYNERYSRSEVHCSVDGGVGIIQQSISRQMSLWFAYRAGCKIPVAQKSWIMVKFKYQEKKEKKERRKPDQVDQRISFLLIADNDDIWL